MLVSHEDKAFETRASTRAGRDGAFWHRTTAHLNRHYFLVGTPFSLSILQMSVPVLAQLSQELRSRVGVNTTTGIAAVFTGQQQKGTCLTFVSDP